jgi:hypothetical protein
MAQGLKLEGSAFFDRFNAAGEPQGFVEFPNLLTLALEADSETKEVISTGLKNAGSVLDSYAKAQPTKGSISVNQMDDKKSLAAFFLGDDSDLNIAAGMVSNEEVVLMVGKLVELTQRNISKTGVATVTSPTTLTLGSGQLIVFQKAATPTLTLTDPSANDATLSTVVTDNDVVVSLATDNAGAITTTAAQLVTELNLNGSIVAAMLGSDSDGSDAVAATAQASLANATAIAATDFDVQHELGLIQLNKALYEGGLYSVAYSHAAIEGYQISAATNTTVKGKLLFVGKNAVNGNTVELEALKVTLSPSGSMELLGDSDFAEGAWDISFEVATGQVAPFTIRNYGAQV